MAIPPVGESRGKTTKWVITGGLVLAAALWITTTIAAVVKAPGIGSFFAGLFGGFIVALIVAGGAAWFALSLVIPSPKPAPIDTAEVTR